MHLQAITLADIVDLSGTKVLPNIEMGVHRRHSNLNWPKQQILKSW